MKFTIAGIVFILFVATVVADQTTDNTEAVQTISGRRKMSGIYDEPCEKTLANTSDPKELIKQGFDASIKNISNVLKTTTLWTNATNDKYVKSTFNLCLDVLGRALDDLNTSMVLVEALGASPTKEAVQDVRVKISAVGSNYGVCSDALNESWGDKHTCDKMMNLLNTSRKLTDIGSARFYCAYKKMWEVKEEAESVVEYEERKKKEKKKKKMDNMIYRGRARNVK